MSHGRVELGHYDICEINFDYHHVSATGGSFAPTLRLRPIITKMHPAHPTYSDSETFPYSIISLQGGVYLDYDRNKRNELLTRFCSTGVLARSWYGRDQGFEIDLILDRSRLYWIEATRKENLHLRIEGSVTIAISTNPEAERKLGIGNVLCFEEGKLELRIEIPQSHWVTKLLPGLGWGDFILIEVPFTQEVLKRGWKYLKEAQRAFDNWNVKELVSSCRELVVYLNRALPRHLGKENKALQLCWARATQGATDYFSLPLHEESIANQDDDEAIDYVFQKHDAEFALTYAKILMKYAQELCLRHTPKT